MKKETLCSLNWQCPKCGKKYAFVHWPEGDEFTMTFSCPKEKDVSENSITFDCECGWKFRIWMEKEEVEY